MSTAVTGGLDLDAITTRQQFAIALTAVRQGAGLTVRQVARATGINPSTVGGYYSGRHLPPLRPEGGVRALLRACGVSDPDELEAWQKALARIRRAPGPRPGALPPPFVGLRPYGPQDADRFHGRTDQVQALLERTRAEDGGITVVLGEAGCGKSSVLGAGLMPRLGAGPDARTVAVLTPGSRPLHGLADALADLVGADTGEVMTHLQRSPGSARDLLLPLDPPAVIVVDQFEDLFAHCPDDDVRVAFVTALAAACRPGSRGEPPAAAVVVALRSTFLSQAARHPDLMSSLASPAGAPVRTVLIPPLSGEPLRAALLGATQAVDLDVEDGLLDRVLADAEGAPAPALPRVGHALARTWQAGGRRRLTLQDYAETGGVASVAAAAETAYLALDEDARRSCRTLLCEMLSLTPGGPVAVGPLPTDPADAALAAAVGALTGQGLLIATDDGAQPASTCLPLLWPRLREWLTTPDRAQEQPCRPDPIAASLAQAPVAAPERLVGRRDERTAEPGWWAWRWAVAAAVVSVLLLAGVAYELWP